MRNKNLLMEQIERETKYLAEQTVGTEEYVKSQERLMALQKQLTELDDQTKRFGLETIKVAGGILLPIIGLIGITAAEKEITFTGALREYTKYFLPGKK